MTMLKSIALAGFKSFGTMDEVPLGPLNVLIGANGSGKSNFLSAFSFLEAFCSNRLNNYVKQSGGADRILHFGSRTTQQMELRVEFEDTDAYTLKFFHGSGDLLQRDEDDHLYLGMQKYPDMGITENNTIERLSCWKFYHFHDTGFHSPMKKTANLHDNRFFREDGANLASFLYLLREKYEDSYRLIRNTLRQVAPFFDDFALKPLELNPDTILLEWRHKNSDAYFDASSLSDGTLRFLALAALLLQPPQLRPEIVLLDEPELGLHPYAIAMLAAMMRFASHKTQIVAATQSPTLLDHFEPEDVLVAERDSGKTRLNRLEAEPLRDWLEEYSLGQLWEKNHFGGRPVREGADTG